MTNTNPDTISDRLACFGIFSERDSKTVNDGKRCLYQGQQFIGRYDVMEAISLLDDLTYGVDDQ